MKASAISQLLIYPEAGTVGLVWENRSALVIHQDGAVQLRRPSELLHRENVVGFELEEQDGGTTIVLLEYVTESPPTRRPLGTTRDVAGAKRWVEAAHRIYAPRRVAA